MAKQSVETMPTLCPFFDGSTKCRKDQGDARKCKGDAARCPATGIYVRRAREVMEELRQLNDMAETNDAVNQPALVAKALGWTLGRTARRPSRWWDDGK